MNITLRLLSVKCLNFSLTEYGEKNQNQIPFDKYEFTFNLNFNIVEESNSIRTSFFVKLKEKAANNAMYDLADLETFLEIQIVNFEEIIIKEDNKIKLPNILINLANTMTIDHARGMLSVLLDNTHYSNALLPLVNPDQLEFKMI
jgi:hypothetical protein